MLRSGISPWRCLLVIIGCKLLLFPAYRSTDFEVHRNWLAITASLPLRAWYRENTSPWTLDYPPFFAWFEKGLSVLARFADAQMLDVQALNYASGATVVFQRSTVLLADVVLLGLALSFVRVRRRESGGVSLSLQEAAFVLWPLVHAGLVIVDNIHFQYNGWLFALFAASIWLVQRSSFLTGSAAFAALVCSKHLFAVVGPVFAVHLARHAILARSRPWRATAALGSVVAAVCAAAILPFHHSLVEMLQRLFPFDGRGLVHAYWAPNVWALYCFADRALAVLLRRKASGLSSTGGLVEDAAFAVLPPVSPRVTAIATLIALVPVCVAAWRSPHRFAHRVALGALVSFLLGWHVHEKAILTATVALWVDAVHQRVYCGEPPSRCFAPLSIVGSWTLFPLLFQPAEYGVMVTLWGIDVIVVLLLSGRSTAVLWASSTALMEVVCLVVSRSYPALPFLPLMIRSVVGALCFTRVYAVGVAETVGIAGGRTPRTKAS